MTLKKHSPAGRPGVDGRILAIENEERVLRALARFGWLPTRQIASLIWPNSASPRLAQRTLARLREQREVNSRTGPDGSTVYALAAAGARRLGREFGLSTRITKDAMRHIERTFEHRCLANEVCIWWLTSDFEGSAGVYTEHEVATGQAILTKKNAHEFLGTVKVPDALLLMRPKEKGHPDALWLGWIEVERGHKNRRDQEKMVAALAHILGRTGTQMRVDSIHQVRFAMVVCPRKTHETRLVRYMLDFLIRQRFGQYSDSYIRDNLHIWRPNGETPTMAELIRQDPELRQYENDLRIKYRL